MKKAFTLSEVLIAVTIIGIIASLTLPTIINNFQQKAMLTALNTNYVELQQNLTFLQSERFNKGTLTKSILSLANPASNTIDTSAGKFFEDYYKATAKCGEASTGKCFAAKYNTISGSSANFNCNVDGREGKSILLKNESAICIIPADMSGTTFVPAIVYIDVNGPKNPNKAGRDLFTFNIYNDFSLDEISPEDIKNGVARKSLDNCKTATSPLAEGCFGQILENNWKMNY